MGIEVFFDEAQVSVGGAAEVFEFVAGEFEVGAGADFLVDTRGADLVADGELVRAAGFVVPAFEPDPDVFLVVEEFAAMAGGDGAENCAAEARFGVDKVILRHEGGATEWLQSRSILLGGVVDFEGILDAGTGDFSSARGVLDRGSGDFGGFFELREGWFRKFWELNRFDGSFDLGFYFGDFLGAGGGFGELRSGFCSF